MSARAAIPATLGVLALATLVVVVTTSGTWQDLGLNLFAETIGVAVVPLPAEQRSRI